MLNNKKPRVRQLVVTMSFIVLSSLLGACSSMSMKTNELVSTATNLVDLARGAGAEKYAPEMLKSATDYLAEANRSATGGNYIAARRYAERAISDAQLAEAQAQEGSRNAQIAALREEIADIKSR